MVDRTLGLVGGLVFVAIGIAYLALGHTGGEIVGVVLIVPYIAWLARTVRRRAR